MNKRLCKPIFDLDKTLNESKLFLNKQILLK